MLSYKDCLPYVETMRKTALYTRQGERPLTEARGAGLYGAATLGGYQALKGFKQGFQQNADLAGKLKGALGTAARKGRTGTIAGFLTAAAVNLMFQKLRDERAQAGSRLW